MEVLSTPISYHRLNRNPLDDSEVFNNLRDLMDYCDTGARYDGQRVVVLNDNLKPVEYVIKNNIPLIDMKGSEPIFKSGITFSGESVQSHGLLIYEDNNSNGNIWSKDDVFILSEGKLCLLNQLEIFRINNNGTKIFKFFLQRGYRNNVFVETEIWNQSYNPYIDGASHIPTVGGNFEISFNETSNVFIRSNKSAYNFMAKTSAIASQEKNYVTKIYVKAEDYYQAWN